MFNISVKNDNNDSPIFGLNTTFTIIMYIVMLLLAIYRVKIGFNVAIDYDAALIPSYDSGFFLTGALGYRALNNTSLALIKNKGYMFVLALSHILKMTPTAMSALLYVITAIVVFILVNHLTKNKFISLLFYIFVLYHPIGFFQNLALQIYRNDVFFQFAMIFLASLFLLFYRIIKKETYIINFLIATFCSISFAMSYLLTETGVLQLLILIFFTILFIFYIIIVSRENKKIKILFCLLPLVFSSLLLFTYKYLNYRTFNVFVYNIRTEGSIGEFIGTVQSIESDSQNKHIWCSFDQLDKAYEASDSFKENQELYEYLKNSDFGTEKDKGWFGDFLGWSIMLALEDLKITYKEANEIFKKINNDLKVAFKNGTLIKTKKIALSKSLGHLDKEDLNTCFKISKSVFESMVTFRFLDNYIYNFGKSTDKTNIFIEYYNIDNEKEFTDYKYFIKKLIPVYSVISILFLIVTFLVWGIVLIINFINIFKYKISITLENIITNYNIYFVLSVGFFIISILYVFSLSNFFIWFHEFDDSYTAAFNFASLAYNYGSIFYSFIILSIIFMLSAIIALMPKIIKRV